MTSESKPGPVPELRAVLTAAERGSGPDWPEPEACLISKSQ